LRNYVTGRQQKPRRLGCIEARVGERNNCFGPHARSWEPHISRLWKDCRWGDFLQTALKSEFHQLHRRIPQRSLVASSASLAFNHLNPACFAGYDDLYLREDQTRLHRNAIMQGLPLGSARGKRIRDGVALYSPALKIYTTARLCHRQDRQATAAELL
jgi:hypothetical protein